MKKIIYSIIAIALMLAGGYSISMGAHAEGEDGENTTPDTAVQISPTAVTVTLMGGDILAGTHEKCPKDLEGGCVVEVKNTGTKPFRYRVYATPYVVKGEDYQVDFSESASTSYTQISRWITFLNEEAGTYDAEITRQIEPGETQVINYRVDVPEDVPGGAQYAVIWAQTLNDGSASGIQTTSRAGTVVSGRSIGDTKRTADVYEYGFQRFALGGGLDAKATIKNTGNTDFDVYYSYTAKTLFGKELYSESDSIATYPDTEYHVNVNWENTPLFGLFTVNFRISAADTVKEETHIVIIMPIFVMVLLILLLTIVIIWIIIIIRKRKERKSRALV